MKALLVLFLLVITNPYDSIDYDRVNTYHISDPQDSVIIEVIEPLPEKPEPFLFLPMDLNKALQELTQNDYDF